MTRPLMVDDVLDLPVLHEPGRDRLRQQEVRMEGLTRQWEQHTEAWQAERRELRQSVQSLGRHFETVASSLTDNQEVIRGIQALARLVTQSSQT